MSVLSPKLIAYCLRYHSLYFVPHECMLRYKTHPTNLYTPRRPTLHSHPAHGHRQTVSYLAHGLALGLTRHLFPHRMLSPSPGPAASGVLDPLTQKQNAMGPTQCKIAKMQQAAKLIFRGTVHIVQACLRPSNSLCIHSGSRS
jgi:hypothetical protein